MEGPVHHGRHVWAFIDGGAQTGGHIAGGILDRTSSNTSADTSALSSLTLFGHYEHRPQIDTDGITDLCITLNRWWAYSSNLLGKAGSYTARPFLAIATPSMLSTA